MEKKYIGAIDQGTTSTRFFIYDSMGSIKASARREHAQIYPGPGLVEHDPMEIWNNTCEVINEALSAGPVSPGEIAAIGITNQRETTVIWDKATGKPCYNAIVWQDTRTAAICRKLSGKAGIGRFMDKTGLPLATYFSGPKIRWLLDNVPGIAEGIQAGRLIFGNMDTWILWNLTGRHITDVTNASRTLLFNIEKMRWDEEILEIMGIKPSMLPEVRPSSCFEDCPHTDRHGPFKSEIPVSGDLGDQQAALFGQACFKTGEAKNTYGTGCFLLLNTGEKRIVSRHGLLTTIGYQIAGQKPVYALEGSVAIAGSLVQWARDRLGMIGSAAEINELAASAPDNGGVYFVPAFSGLFAPYWRPDARGLVIGLTHYTGKVQIARAILEATAFQTRDVFDAMETDSGVKLTNLKVDGGMTASVLLMQFQADILNVPVLKPKVAESTSLGAAYAAGLAAGFWKGTGDIIRNWTLDMEWKPRINEDGRSKLYGSWRRAVERTFGWADEKEIYER